jgi:hypothetical protein
MHSTSLKTLERLRPATKREWAGLLGREPAASALANPDTLDQLRLGLLEPGEKWLRQSVTATGSARARCRCSFNPLITCFATGEIALRAVLAGELASELGETLRIFLALAHEEIEALCSIC